MFPQLYVSVQNTYHCLQLALFSQEICLQKMVLQGTRASSHLILHIDTLLKNNNLTLSDLNFITVDKGPGAFTSLRVAIASINGIAFSHKMPLVGVDGLEALLQDGLAKAVSHNNIVGVVALLNAYNHDAYFGIVSIDDAAKKQMGCKKIQEVVITIQQMFPTGNLLVLGNGATVFLTELQDAFNDRLVIESPVQEVSSVERIAELGYQQWLGQQERSYNITPNYLKTQLFVMQK